MLKAGVAIRELTPKTKTFTAGYPEPEGRSAEMAHDPLYTSCYYIDNGKTRVMYFCNDIINMTKDRANEVRMLVEKRTGISRKNVAVSCTHTHSGPVTGGDIWANFENLNEVHPENNDRMRDLMVEAACEAVANAFEAKIGYGVGTCGKEKNIGGNRHDPDGPCDPSVNVLAIKDMQDNLRGCVVNYALHPTVLHDHNFFFTADFPAYMRQYLNNIDPFMIFGFSMGCSGNQSTRYFRDGQTYEESKRIGYTIAEEAHNVISSIEYHTDLELKSESVFVTPPLKTFPSHADAVTTAAKAKSEYEQLIADKAPYPVCRSAECTLIGSNFMEGFTASIERSSLDAIIGRQLPLECHALLIGECLIMGISCENFVEVDLGIQKASPFKMTMISTLTNGCTTGYVCADYAYDQFIYEAQASTFAKGAVDAVINACTEAIAKVK